MNVCTAVLLSDILFYPQEQDALATWKASAWAKKLESKKVRSNLSDFDRFRVMVAKKQRSKIIATKVAELSA